MQPVKFVRSVLATPASSLAAFVLIVLSAAPAPAATAATAVVHGLHAVPSAASTRIIVEIEGAFRYRTQPSDDGKSMLVDIENATIGERTPRILPISDRRIDGVIVLTDTAARIVRISVDVAGRVAPRLKAGVESSRLVLEFVDASGAPSSAASSALSAAPSSSARNVASPREPARERNANRIAVAGKANARKGNAEKTNDAGTPAARAAAADGADGARTVSRSRDARPAGTDAVEAGASPASQKSIVQKPVVVLDPGHGGKDPGARAWTGEYEKDIVLDLAERVARRLRKGGDVEVVMTRSGDEYVELADRRDTSRLWNADAFVSIHANASHSAAARGIETYYYKRKTGGSAAPPDDRQTRRLARAENGGRTARDRSASKAGVSPASLSSTLPPVLDRRAESARLASLVQGELVRQLGMRYEAVRDLGAKEGPFFVIGHNAAPSVLVEAAFLTHREEGLRMRSEVYREQIADGVARGIVAFLDQQRRSGAL